MFFVCDCALKFIKVFLICRSAYHQSILDLSICISENSRNDPSFVTWQPKWNNRLLGAFKIDYIGIDPYINCIPSLCHHRIGPNDKFLVLSSDGLYQYFTNKEVVDQVEMFTAAHPEGDPAQHLASELLLRAAKKAGEQ
jgi:serine/threonine protein phosphatase PrpC